VAVVTGVNVGANVGVDSSVLVAMSDDETVEISGDETRGLEVSSGPLAVPPQAITLIPAMIEIDMIVDHRRMDCAPSRIL